MDNTGKSKSKDFTQTLDQKRDVAKQLRRDFQTNIFKQESFFQDSNRTTTTNICGSSIQTEEETASLKTIKEVEDTQQNNIDTIKALLTQVQSQLNNQEQSKKEAKPRKTTGRRNQRQNSFTLKQPITLLSDNDDDDFFGKQHKDRDTNLENANLAETTNGKKTVKIFNLSSRKLSKSEISVLLRGLKFTPTPDKSNNEQLSNDIAEFHRKLKLKEYFYTNDNIEQDDSLVRNKSFFEPPKVRNEKYWIC